MTAIGTHVSMCGRVADDGWMLMILWLKSYRRRSAEASGIVHAGYGGFYWDLGQPLPGNSCAEQTGGRRA